MAAFWAAMLDGEIAFDSDDFVAVNAGGQWVTTVRVDDHRPPVWPTGDIPKQFHLEVSVDDLDAAQAAAIKLGATLADVQPGPDRWRVLLDPAGHPFCVSGQIPET